MKTAITIAAALVIVVASFFGTLLAIDTYDPDFNGPWKRDRQRAKDAAVLKEAMETYRYSKGAYPVLPDNDVDDLVKVLVTPGLLSSIPGDPLRATAGKKYYRVSSNGSAYGLLFQLERPADKVKAGGLCVTGVKVSGTGIWNGAPDCPFLAVC
jgi:hypothetical protein